MESGIETAVAVSRYLLFRNADTDETSDYHALRPEIGLRNIPLWKL